MPRNLLLLFLLLCDLAVLMLLVASIYQMSKRKMGTKMPAIPTPTEITVANLKLNSDAPDIKKMSETVRSSPEAKRFLASVLDKIDKADRVHMLFGFTCIQYGMTLGIQIGQNRWPLLANPKVEVPFPVHPEGTPMNFEGDPLGEGVRGTAVRSDLGTYIIDIHADNPGSGQVGKWLNSLPSGIKISNLVSSRLEGMLTRRGWVQTNEEDCDVWIKP